MCGCGETTPVARQTHRQLGWVKGEHIKFIKGHATIPVKPRPVEAPLCACGCGNPTNRDYRGFYATFLPSHNKRLTRIVKQCVICGADFLCRPSEDHWKRVCGDPACSSAQRSQLLTGIDRKGEWFDVQCACGCGTWFLRPIYDKRENKTGRYFLNDDHQRRWWNECRAKRGPHTAANTRYGFGWKKLARSIRERDKVCRDCGKTPEANGRALDVHHIVPFRISGNNDPSNLIALCRSCHTKHTAREDVPPIQDPKPLRYAEEKTCPVCDEAFTANLPGRKLCFKPECLTQHRKEWSQRYYLARKAARSQH